MASNNHPGRPLVRRNGVHRPENFPHGAPTAHTLGRPARTPYLTPPQVAPDSYEMLACDCMHEATHARMPIKAGSACMPTGHRTPG